MKLSESFFQNCSLNPNLFAWIRNATAENKKDFQKISANRWFYEFEFESENSGVCKIEEGCFFVGLFEDGEKKIRSLTNDVLPAKFIRVEIVNDEIVDAYFITQKNEPLHPLRLLVKINKKEFKVANKDFLKRVQESSDFWQDKEYQYGN